MDHVQMDQGIEYSELIECEIESLMYRLYHADPDGLLRLEKLYGRFRKEVTVQRVDISKH